MLARSRPKLAAWAWLLGLSVSHLMAGEPSGSAKECLGEPSATNTQAGPRIQFKSAIFDFGRVAAGTVVPCLFEFSNIGDEPLRILDITTSCGCTSLGDWDRALAAGGTGAMVLQFATSNFNGTVYKPVWVASTAVGQSNTLLHITGTVWLPVECLPSAAGFGVLGNRTIQTNQSVRIINNLTEPITLEPPISSNPCFRPRLQTLKAGQEFLLEVATVPPLSNGLNAGVISIRTSAAQSPVVTVPVRAMVQPILIIPPQLFLSRNTNGEPTQLSAAIFNNAEQNLLLSDPQINLEGVKLQMRQILPGRQYRVDLTFPDQAQVSAAGEVVLRLKTNHPDFPTLELPVLPPTAR